MQIFRFLVATCCTFLIACLTTSYASSVRWPVDNAIDLASGFGDYRSGRFHAGLDIRTGGRIGAKVFAPVDGYVKRVKTSYFGYGKGLYVAGDDGRTYVFGHLDQYAPTVDRALKAAQYRDQRYYEDLFFPKDSLRVRQGELIALSGQTGSGAPHLHFESRTAEDKPINPLRHGFPLKDKVRPSFTRLGIELTDERSLLPDGKRQWFFSVKGAGKAGQAVVDTIPYLDRPFGLLVECSDRMRADGMEQAVYSLRVYVDDSLWYESKFDTLDFATGQASYFEYSFGQVSVGKNRVRRLYQSPGDEFAGSRATNEYRGIIGMDADRHVGMRRVRIEAGDFAGNTATLTFTYRQGPTGNAMVVDSAVTGAADTTRYFLTTCTDYDRLAFDSIAVCVNKSDRWGRGNNAIISRRDKRHPVLTVVARNPENVVMALGYYTGNQIVHLDQPFSGIRDKQGVRARLEWELTHDGVLVKVLSDERFAMVPRVQLYYRGQLLGIEKPAQYFSMSAYYVLIPAREQYVRVDKIGLVTVPDSLYPLLDTEEVNLAVAGIRGADTLVLDEKARVIFEKDDLFFPRFVGVRANKLMNPGLMKLNSSYYEVLPEEFVAKRGYTLQVTLPPGSATNAISGICWLDKAADRWVWLGDNVFRNDTLTATTTGSGSFAAVMDVERPYVGDFSIPPRSVITDRLPKITFTVRDTLSGLADDRSIDIKLDNKWMIPEYDPEAKQCRFQPPDSLAVGDHHLAVTVTDRAGNRTEQFSIFSVIEGKKPAVGAVKKTKAGSGHK